MCWSCRLCIWEKYYLISHIEYPNVLALRVLLGRLVVYLRCIRSGPPATVVRGHFPAVCCIFLRLHKQVLAWIHSVKSPDSQARFQRPLPSPVGQLSGNDQPGYLGGHILHICVHTLFSRASYILLSVSVCWSGIQSPVCLCADHHECS